MNKVTEGFLDTMKGKIESDVAETLKKQADEKLCKNLLTLVKEGIITKADADDFSRKHGVNINIPTKRTPPKPTIADDGCGHSVLRSTC